jgi:trans-2-enoyl-CoA reductase
MEKRTDRRNLSNAPLRVLVVGGWGSNWKIRSEVVPGCRRSTRNRIKKSTSKGDLSNVPLRVLVVGGFGSNWKIRRETVPGATRYSSHITRTSSSRSIRSERKKRTNI